MRKPPLKITNGDLLRKLDSGLTGVAFFLILNLSLLCALFALVVHRLPESCK